MAGSEHYKPGRILYTELHQYGRRRANDGPYADNLDLDVLVVGAGFAGIYLLEEMRKAGYRIVLYDAGTRLGGNWRWNIYPGARVDSEMPVYEFSWPRVHQSWYWSCNYPDWPEIQAYFDHVDKVMNLSKDCAFETVVTGAEFNEKEAKWTVETADGRTSKTKYLIIATGFSAKRYIPEFKSLEKFKGIIHHSSFWPPEEINAKGKRCAVIGTGASGVQISQEWGPVASELTVFQRTPNLAIPMRFRWLTKEEQDLMKPAHKELTDYREKCFSGMYYDFNEQNTLDVTVEEREAYLEKIWMEGGFKFWDYYLNEDANRVMYDFWLKKQSPRVQDPAKRALLFPKEPPHPFGVKRPSLEQNYYEQFNRDNVYIIDISEKSGNSIEEFTETGIQTKDGKHYEFDIIALATGFDAVTGSIANMGLKSINGTYLKDEWETGADTYLGTTISGYPNLFSVYGAHGPTLLANGPTIAEIQGRWVRDAINLSEKQGLKYIDPTKEATDEWKHRILSLANATLFPTTKSTYMGSAIPGKKFEPLCYHGGIPAYKAEIRSKLPAFDGFRTVKV